MNKDVMIPIGEVLSPNGNPYIKLYADSKLVYASLAAYNFQYKVSIDKRALPQLIEILQKVV